MQPSLETLYDKIGADNLQKLLDHFYDLVYQDEVLSAIFKEEKEIVKAKQYLFLTQFLGGPLLYTEKHGHPKLRRRHLAHAINEEAAMRWLKCMANAIDTLDIEETIKDELFNRFPPVAAHMINS